MIHFNCDEIEEVKQKKILVSLYEDKKRIFRNKIMLQELQNDPGLNIFQNC